MRTLILTTLLLAACDDKETAPDVIDTGEPCSPEVPYDGVDNDCDAATPDDDLDGDGLNLADDCDDEDASLGGDEVPYDGVDNDCDATTPDDDLDGDGQPLSDDCDDDDPLRYSGADEVCDEIDNDCDTEVDEEAVDASSWYADTDGDGFGDEAVTMQSCEAPSGHVSDSTDCDDTLDTVSPLGEEACNTHDDDCDGENNEGLTCLSFGGHRVEKDGEFYYALYNDDGFGIVGTSDWHGASDITNSPEGVTWNEDFTVFYYNDLGGNVFSQTEPFTSASTMVGSFDLGQVGGGVIHEDHYYVGDYTNGDIYRMDVSDGSTSLYASLGTDVCRPYFGNSAMAIDVDGSIYAASYCGIVRYAPDDTAEPLNTYKNLISAVAMNADQELFSVDRSGQLMQFDKKTGETLSTVLLSATPSSTWTLAFDSEGNILVNYWGEQRLYSSKDGGLVEYWSAVDYYPGDSGYYWYVTF